MATKPVALGASPSSESGEIPDAFALLRAAEEEMPEVKVLAQPNWRVPARPQRSGVWHGPGCSALRAGRW